MFDGVFGPATEKTRLKNSSRASPFGSAVAAKGASMRRLVHIRARAAILDLLNCDRILRCYEHAAGSELLSGKFASPESSAALAANTFGFFLDRPEVLSLPARISISATASFMPAPPWCTRCADTGCARPSRPVQHTPGVSCGR